MIFKKPYLIAEIGVNYYDIARKYRLPLMTAAKLMIKKAKEGGADAAKFQAYKAEKIASKNSPAYWDRTKEPTANQFQLFKKFDEFGAKEYKKLAGYCRKIGLDFLCTPFDLESVDFLAPLIKYFKVASADITNLPLLKKIIKQKKPLLISTGASTLKEVGQIVHLIKGLNRRIPIVLLHCVLSYPTKFENANLKRISILKEKFKDCLIGYSDHTLPDENMVLVSAAYALGAQVIEKHFTLDKKLPGNDHYHAMDTEDLKKFRENIDLLNIALSKSEGDFLPCEKIPRRQARRSLVAVRNLARGKIIKANDLIAKRPGTGISPFEINKVIGKKVKKNIKEDELLTWIKIKRHEK